MPRKKARKRRKKKQARNGFLRRHPWWTVVFAFTALFLAYLLFLNWQISDRFEGRRWDLPFA